MKRLKILNLFWHTVESDCINPEYYDGAHPTVSNLRDQIKFIVGRYTPISIFDFMKIKEDQSLIYSYKRPPVLLGFDDGYKNVINHALPILNEFKIPAVLFVIGEILKNPNFVPWYIERKHLLRKTKKKTIIYDNTKIVLVLKRSRELLKRLVKNSFEAYRSEEDRQRLLTNLANLLGVKRPTASELDDDLRFVSKEDLLNLGSNSLLTVASHAMTHRCLASLSHEEQTYELKQSNLLLRGHCPSYYPTISYPDGSFNKDTIAIAKRIYKCAFAVFLGSSYHNFYAYPRIGLRHRTIQELEYITSSKRLNYILPAKRFFHSIGICRIN